MNFDEAISLWREGELRLVAADPDDRPILDRVVEAVVSELRRRLGGSFTRRELVELYEQQGSDWCLDVAMSVAPSTPAAWDLTTVAGAAFARYARQASDFRTLAVRPPGMDPG
ncbi:MAG: hypothetical protein ACRDPA_04065 [Solirubrobacteraceae bacterium]